MRLRFPSSAPRETPGHRFADQGFVMGHASSAASLRYLKASEQRPRDHRRHRSADGPACQHIPERVDDHGRAVLLGCGGVGRRTTCMPTNGTSGMPVVPTVRTFRGCESVGAADVIRSGSIGPPYASCWFLFGPKPSRNDDSHHQCPHSRRRVHVRRQILAWIGTAQPAPTEGSLRRTRCQFRVA